MPGFMREQIHSNFQLSKHVQLRFAMVKPARLALLCFVCNFWWFFGDRRFGRSGPEFIAMIIDWDNSCFLCKPKDFLADSSGPPTKIANNQNSINNTAHTDKILRTPYE